MSKALNTTVNLAIWQLWKHRHDVVFEGTSLSVQLVIAKILQEGWEWQAVGKFRQDMTLFYQWLYMWAFVRG